MTQVLCQQELSDSLPLPYYEISEVPEAFTAGATAARMVDGLGFRFYWATDSLRSGDLTYRPGEDARSIQETINHIYSMSFMILNAVSQEKSFPDKNAGYELKRKTTLYNLLHTSEILMKSSEKDLEKYTIQFKEEELPFWNLINGPIADCLWHCGQIVSHRRSAGNPLNSKVSFLRGTVKK